MDRTSPDAAGDELEERFALIAHELRSPLAVMLSASETLATLLMEDDPDLPYIADIVDVVRRHSRLATKLVDRLAILRDVRDEKVDLALQRLEVTQLVDDIVDDVSIFVLGDRVVRVSHPEPLVSSFDPSALAEILFNLLDNAARYSPAHEDIEVSVAREAVGAPVDGSPGVVVIVVRDHGEGIEPGDVEALFGPFVRGDGDHDELGVGLGLYVSRGLARAHGGELRARPAVGGGTEFIVELPDRAA